MSGKKGKKERNPTFTKRKEFDEALPEVLQNLDNAIRRLRLSTRQAQCLSSYCLGRIKKYWDKIPCGRGQKAFLRRMAYHGFIDLKFYGEPEFHEPFQDEHGAHAAPNWQWTAVYRANHPTYAQVEWGLAMSVLEAHDPRYRRIVESRLLHGLPWKEVEQRTGIPMRSAKEYYRKSTALLRAHYRNAD